MVEVYDKTLFGHSIGHMIQVCFVPLTHSICFLYSYYGVSWWIFKHRLNVGCCSLVTAVIDSVIYSVIDYN